MILGTDVRLESPNPTPMHVASPELKWKPIEARGLGAALGSQWVQGRALVGGSGRAKPPRRKSKIEYFTVILGF